MQAEIVTIGTELLLGEIVDTNSAWIAQQLTHIGLNLYYTATVGDNTERVADVLRASLKRSDIVITTGGLGPTVDDVTRDAVARATDRQVVYDGELFEEIAAYFARRGHPMTDNNRKQACLPAGARVIHNPVGTAPAFSVERDGHLIISLPGVPHEMRYLMQHEVIPTLCERYGLAGVIVSRVLHTCGIGESNIDSRIGDLMALHNPTVGTAAHPGQTDVRITAKGASLEEAMSLIEPVEAEMRQRVGEFIYGIDDQSLGDVVTALLSDSGLRIAVADTTTRGGLCRALATGSQADASVAGSATFAGPGALCQALGLDRQRIPSWGTVSQDVADAAAESVRRLFRADLGLALVGPPDPGADDALPAHFALSREGALTQRSPRKGRSGIAGQGWLVHLALDMVRRQLLGLTID